MNKSEELNNTAALVKSILEMHPQARNSDNYLFYLVCKTIGRRNGIEIDEMSMPKFMLHLKEYGFPQFETVRRTRQKIQAAHSELAGNSKVEAQRLLNEESFRDFARGHIS
jgi:hypothetical protein